MLPKAPGALIGGVAICLHVSHSHCRPHQQLIRPSSASNAVEREGPGAALVDDKTARHVVAENKDPPSKVLAQSASAAYRQENDPGFLDVDVLLHKSPRRLDDGPPPARPVPAGRQRRNAVGQLDKGQVVRILDKRGLSTASWEIAVDQRGKGGASGGRHKSGVRATGRGVCESLVIIIGAVRVPAEPEEAAHVVQSVGAETRDDLRHQDIVKPPSLSERRRRMDLQKRRARRHESVACVRRITTVHLGRERGPEVDGSEKAEIGEDANLTSHVAGHEPRGAPDLVGKEVNGLQD